MIPADHSARIVDAVLMGLLVARVSVPGLDIPVGQAAVVGLVAISICRRPTRSLSAVWWFPAVSAGLLLFLAAESQVNHVDFSRRLTNIAALLLMAGFLASGRIDVGSALKGLVLAGGL